MLQYRIQQEIEKWIEAGRHRDAICENNQFVLWYGPRFRNSQLVNLAVFVAFLTLGIIGVELGAIKDWKLILFFFAVFSLATVGSLIYVAYVLTSRVTIDNDSIRVYYFGQMASRCTREDVLRAFRSKTHPSLVIVDKNGRKTRISTQFDGLRAVVGWLSMLPDDVLDDAIRQWMLDEDQDPDEQNHAPKHPVGRF